MSKADRQALCQLSAVMGCLSVLDKSNAFARVDIRREIKSALATAEQAILQWPVTGDDNDKIIAWVNKRFTQWADYVFLSETDTISARIVVKIADRVIVSLWEIVKNKTKKALLEPVLESLAVIHGFSDPYGAFFEDFNEADRLVDELNRIIGMEVLN